MNEPRNVSRSQLIKSDGPKNRTDAILRRPMLTSSRTDLFARIFFPIPKMVFDRRRRNRLPTFSKAKKILEGFFFEKILAWKFYFLKFSFQGKCKEGSFRIVSHSFRPYSANGGQFECCSKCKKVDFFPFGSPRWMNLHNHFTYA